MLDIPKTALLFAQLDFWGCRLFSKMQHRLSSLTFLFVYLDDILVDSSSRSEHMALLQILFEPGLSWLIRQSVRRSLVKSGRCGKFPRPCRSFKAWWTFLTALFPKRQGWCGPCTKPWNPSPSNKLLAGPSGRTRRFWTARQLQHFMQQHATMLAQSFTQSYNCLNHRCFSGRCCALAVGESGHGNHSLFSVDNYVLTSGRNGQELLGHFLAIHHFLFLLGAWQFVTVVDHIGSHLLWVRRPNPGQPASRASSPSSWNLPEAHSLSELWNALAESLGVKPHCTTAYDPQYVMRAVTSFIKSGSRQPQVAKDTLTPKRTFKPHQPSCLSNHFKLV